MKVVGKQLAGALRAAELFASTDETKTHQNCVSLEPMRESGHDHLRIVSTDGHRLWACEIDVKDIESDAPQFLVPLLQVGALAKFDGYWALLALRRDPR